MWWVRLGRSFRHALFVDGDLSMDESSRDECNRRVFDGIQGLATVVVRTISGSSGIKFPRSPI